MALRASWPSSRAQGGQHRQARREGTPRCRSQSTSCGAPDPHTTTDVGLRAAELGGAGAEGPAGPARLTERLSGIEVL